MLIFYFGNTSGYCARYLDLVIIPIYVFATYSLSYYIKRKTIAALIVGIIILTMFIFMYPMLNFRRHSNIQKQFALYVKEKTEDNAVVVAMDDGPFIEYYGKRRYITHPTGGDREEISYFIKSIDTYLKDGVQVYLTEFGLIYDPGEAVKRQFSITLI